MSQMERIRCAILRGGTSKGMFLMENDLPADKAARDKTILKVFGSPDVRQIDGLGGADPLTSKLAVIGPLELQDVAGLDIYTSVASYLNADLSNETGVSNTGADRVAEGKLGLKTGGGLFQYTPEQIQALGQRRGKLLLASKKVLTQE